VTKELTTGFDYDSLDEETAGKLRYFATTGRTLLRQSVESIAKMGELLSEARKELSHRGSGTFVKWATEEFDISKQTVFNYVNAWERCLSNGWTNFQNLSHTAIYLLSEENTPAPVLKKVANLAAQNEPVRRADVQRLIDAAKPKPKPPSKPTEQPGPQRATPASVAQITAQSKQVAAQLATVETTPAWKLQRSKAKKTAEALIRALQDLNDIRPITFVRSSVDDCLAIISELEAMR
jgi:uncharacterized protein with beta-barrel porin domain